MTVSVNRRQLLGLLGIGAVIGLVAACTGKSPSALEQGDRFPEVKLVNMEGEAVTLSAFSGASLLLNFWASWCEPCRHEMPGLQELSKLFSPDQLLIVGVNVDSDVNLAREFILQYGLTFPMLSDKDMRLSNGILRIAGFPMTYILTVNRTIARVVAGERDWVEPQAIEEIERLLKIRRIRTA